MPTMTMARIGPFPAASEPDEAPALTTQEIDTHMRRMFRLIYRIVRNVPDAQDLTQDAFVKALMRKQQLRDSRKTAQWMNRIAVNTALDFVRKRARVSFDDLDRAPASTAASPEKELLRSETRDWIEGGLRLLSARERTALLLRDFEGMPSREVASVMGCSMATVRSHIANARVKFRRYREETS